MPGNRSCPKILNSERMKMFKKGFDNDKYIKTQSEQIRKRMSRFGGKLYMEFGGKLPALNRTAS